MAVVTMLRRGKDDETGMITKWYKKAGDWVRPGDDLFAYDTDSGSFEVKSEQEGRLVAIFLPEGELAHCPAEVGMVATPTPEAALRFGRAQFLGEEQPVSPRAAAAARALGVDPQYASPTGPGGMVVEGDVLQLDAAQRELMERTVRPEPPAPVEAAAELAAPPAPSEIVAALADPAAPEPQEGPAALAGGLPDGPPPPEASAGDAPPQALAGALETAPLPAPGVPAEPEHMEEQPPAPPLMETASALDVEVDPLSVPSSLAADGEQEPPAQTEPDANPDITPREALDGLKEELEEAGLEAEPDLDQMQLEQPDTEDLEAKDGVDSLPEAPQAREDSGAEAREETDGGEPGQDQGSKRDARSDAIAQSLFASLAAAVQTLPPAPSTPDEAEAARQDAQGAEGAGGAAPAPLPVQCAALFRSFDRTALEGMLEELKGAGITEGALIAWAASQLPEGCLPPVEGAAGKTLGQALKQGALQAGWLHIPGGVEACVPQLVQGQAAALGVGAPSPRLRICGGTLSGYPASTLCLVYDAASVSGGAAARTLEALCQVLERPARLLLL